MYESLLSLRLMEHLKTLIRSLNNTMPSHINDVYTTYTPTIRMRAKLFGFLRFLNIVWTKFAFCMWTIKSINNFTSTFTAQISLPLLYCSNCQSIEHFIAFRPSLTAKSKVVYWINFDSIVNFSSPWKFIKK